MNLSSGSRGLSKWVIQRRARLACAFTPGSRFVTQSETGAHWASKPIIEDTVNLTSQHFLDQKQTLMDKLSLSYSINGLISTCVVQLLPVIGTSYQTFRLQPTLLFQLQ